MRILMLSANTGEGHNATARAMTQSLEKSGVDCTIVDTLEYLSPALSKFICSWHVRLYKYAPKLWDKGYRALEKNIGDGEEFTPIYEILAAGAGKLHTVLESGGFDAVVCVHVFAGMMMTEVRRQYETTIPTFFVATDYTCSPYVDHCEMDYYVIPAGQLVQEFAGAGIPEQKLLPLGIPVRPEFYGSHDRAAARRELELPESGRVVLLMCGSMGCGPITQIAGDLAKGLTGDDLVVAFCGRNEKVLEELSGIQDKRLRVLGFTDQVEKYMDAADMMVTKPGGLSTTEAANKHLPMVFIDAVGGCEYRNFDFFVDRGYALGSREPEEVLRIALRLASDGDSLQKMKATLASAFTRNGTREICAEIVKAAESYRSKHSEDTAPTVGEKTEEMLRQAAGFKLQLQAQIDALSERAEHADMMWITLHLGNLSRQQGMHARLMLQLLGESTDDIAVPADKEACADLAEGMIEILTEMGKNGLMLKLYRKTAEKEHSRGAADLFRRIAEIDELQYAKLQAVMERFGGGKETEWECLGCGWTYRAEEPRDVCPVCGRKRGWQSPK